MTDAISHATAALGGSLTEPALAEHVFPLFSKALASPHIYLANHSLARTSEYLPMKSGPLFGPAQGCELVQPCRSGLRQQFREITLLAVGGELTHRFEYRVVRFFTAEIARRTRPKASK